MEKMDKTYVLRTYARDYTHFIKGKGSKLFDADGKDFIDFTSGIGVTSLGHGNKHIAKVISKQAKKLLHTSNLFLIAPQAKLAKKISELAGYELGVFFANSGAEANEGAIKLARKYGNKHGKNHIITLKNSFHGRTLATLKATGQDDFHDASFSPFVEGFSFVNDLDALMQKADNKTAAFMIELVQGEGGVNALDKAKVQEVADFCKEKDILLIVDEVQTGVFRTGKFLASQYYGIEPDIITLAKGLGGGVPIGAVLTKHKDIFKAGEHGSTFGGGFLVTQTALKVLERLQKLQKQKCLQQNIKYFDKKLNSLVKRFPHLFEKTKGLGLMRGVKCKEDAKLLVQKAHKKRVLVLKAGLNTMRFLPPLNITKKEIDEGFKRLEKAFS